MYRFTAAVAAAFVATAAQAEAPRGFRIDAIGGLEKLQIDEARVDPRRLATDSEGILFGLGVGYDMPVAASVSVGIDAEITETDAFSGLLAGGRNSLLLKWGRDLYVGGRVSVAVSPRLNLYAKGGYTNVRAQVELTVDPNSGGFRFTRPTDEPFEGNSSGVRGAIGAQYRLFGKVHLGAEYRHSWYEGPLSRSQAVATLGLRF